VRGNRGTEPAWAREGIPGSGEQDGFSLQRVERVCARARLAVFHNTGARLRLGEGCQGLALMTYKIGPGSAPDEGCQDRQELRGEFGNLECWRASSRRRRVSSWRPRGSDDTPITIRVVSSQFSVCSSGATMRLLERGNAECKIQNSKCGGLAHGVLRGNDSFSFLSSRFNFLRARGWIVGVCAAVAACSQNQGGFTTKTREAQRGLRPQPNVRGSRDRGIEG
jgi:hypothetical protein